jgi:hypothetical protein
VILVGHRQPRRPDLGSGIAASAETTDSDKHANEIPPATAEWLHETEAIIEQPPEETNV